MLLSAVDISKRFGASVALDRVSADFAAGEVHALVGENGAGKSTLLKVLAAVVPQDGGEARLDGRPYRPRNLHDAERRGVALVFQELNVNAALGIAENVMLGRLSDYSRLGLLDGRRLRRDAQTVLDQIGADISVRQDIARLDLGQRKIVEVARALAARPRVVFFDESTAFLNNREVQRLLAVIRELRDQGFAIAFVSHYLGEVYDIADRLTVLKDGRRVGCFRAAEVPEARLHELMVGRELKGGLFPARLPPAANDQPRLAIRGLTTRSGIGPIDLAVPAGRILGIGGLKGSGGDAILNALVGADPVVGGTVALDGRPFRPRQPATAWAAGIAYLPGDRTGEGLIPGFAVEENLTLAARPARHGFNDGRTGRRMAGDLVKLLQIKTADLSASTQSLSGGNMQKVVLGKCLGVRPRVLLLNNPTRGVDIGAKTEIYRVLRHLAGEGLSIVMVTEDLTELIGLADQILVTRRGQVAKTYPAGEEPAEEDVVQWMM